MKTAHLLKTGGKVILVSCSRKKAEIEAKKMLLIKNIVCSIETVKFI